MRMYYASCIAFFILIISSKLCGTMQMAQDTLVEKFSFLKLTMNECSENFNQLVMIEKDLYKFSTCTSVLYITCAT